MPQVLPSPSTLLLHPSPHGSDEPRPKYPIPTPSQTPPLSNTPNNQPRNPLLLRARLNLHRRARLGRERQPDAYSDSAAGERLAVELEGVGSRAEDDVRALEGLEGELFD